MEGRAEVQAVASTPIAQVLWSKPNSWGGEAPVFVTPNARAKRATTEWRAGQQAQNGPQAQRLMASVTCRWRSA